MTTKTKKPATVDPFRNPEAFAVPAIRIVNMRVIFTHEIPNGLGLADVVGLGPSRPTWADLKNSDLVIVGDKAIRSEEVFASAPSPTAARLGLGPTWV